MGGKEVPGSNGEIGAYVAKVLPGGAAEQTGKIVEGKENHGHYFSLSSSLFCFCLNLVLSYCVS